jgi:hypothetical protein
MKIVLGERAPSRHSSGWDGLDAHRLRRADRAALRAEVDRICRIEDVALVHAYAQISMIIRDQQSRQTYPGKRLTQSRSSQIADYGLTLGGEFVVPRGYRTASLVSSGCVA